MTDKFKKMVTDEVILIDSIVLDEGRTFWYDYFLVPTPDW
jgi:hypothetical protein